MSAWTGWVGDMIAGLGIPDTADNRAFLNGWANADQSTCRNNPLVCAKPVTGSSNCRPSPGGLHTQNYPSHAAAITATRELLHFGPFRVILGVLESGHPLDQADASGLVTALAEWGAGGWAAEVGQTTGATLPPQPKNAPAHVTTAWTRWMRGLAHKGPESHNRIQKATVRARRIARHR